MRNFPLRADYGNRDRFRRDIALLNGIVEDRAWIPVMTLEVRLRTMLSVFRTGIYIFSFFRLLDANYFLHLLVSS